MREVGLCEYASITGLSEIYGMYVCMYIYVCVCMYVIMYVCMYVCMYVYNTDTNSVQNVLGHL